jgi:hypothetical protein
LVSVTEYTGVVELLDGRKARGAEQYRWRRASGTGDVPAERDHFVEEREAHARLMRFEDDAATSVHCAASAAAGAETGLY